MFNRRRFLQDSIPAAAAAFAGPARAIAAVEMEKSSSRIFAPVVISMLVALAAANASAEPQRDAERQQLRAMQQAYRYSAIVRAYADYMIQHGRDVYGKPSPLFVTGMDRHTGKMIRPPFPHVKRKPFMPGFERDRECRGSDRNYGQADPLDQLILLKLLHRLSDDAGDPRYAQEADKTASWWMANAQTQIGLYPWGTHTYWEVNKEGGGGNFEFNRPWPYWKLNPDALQRYAGGLWDHYVRDKKTGAINRHAHSNRHGPGGGMEFPWPGAAMIATWTEAYLAKPDPEYKRAIATILNRWESLRDPKTGRMAPCSSYQEWVWYQGYMYAANILDDCADLIEEKEPELAEKMREYGRKNDADFFRRPEQRLDVKRIGLVMSYRRDNGDYNAERPDILGGPWQDRKHYAEKALLLYERAKRTDSQALRKRYNQAVLDTAEVYMSINPEVQWAVWGANMSDAIGLMFAAYDLTENAAYLHRAEHFARLCVDLYLDDSSPLPKITSHDDFYEIERVTGKSTDAWMLDLLELERRLDLLDDGLKHSVAVATGNNVKAISKVPVSGMSAARWQGDLQRALAEDRAGVWDCSGLSKPVASVALAYGKSRDRSLFLSRRKEMFGSSDGLPIDQLELIASDFINKIPTLAEAKPFNGPYRRRFSGKHQEQSTSTYGGFKDVLREAGLLLANRGAKAAKVTVTVTFHDTWRDKATKDYQVTLGPGETVLVACVAPENRFIRRLDFKSDSLNAVKLEQFAFVMAPRSKLLSVSMESKRQNRTALVFLIAGQSNAGGVAAFSPESNVQSGMARNHPTIPGSTAREVAIPTAKDGYPKSFIWEDASFVHLTPGGGYYTSPYPQDANRHGIELPMAMLLEEKYPQAEKFFIKHGPGGHNLHTQWAAGSGVDYREFIGRYSRAMEYLKKRYERIRIIGLYWDQGESDRPRATEYGKNLRALFAAIRKDAKMPVLQIFVRKHLFQHGDEGFAPIIRAQVDVAQEDPNVHLLDLDLGSNEKNFKAWAWTDKNGHLSSKAFLELAKRIMTKAAVLEGTEQHEWKSRRHHKK